MRVFQHIVTIATIGAATILLGAPYAAAEQGGGRYWTPMTASTAAEHVTAKTRVARKEAARKKERSILNANARIPSDAKAHNLILQVNTNDPAAMNLALNNATNVAQYYKELGEKVKIEVVTFGPGLHMLREDTSPVKSRIEEMALSTPEISFKACGNTQEKMHSAEKKDIPIIRQAEVVKSGVVRVMELQEKGWSYVKP
ncbi:DsrE family protein [Bradyrhizobium sp. USDA 4452]